MIRFGFRVCVLVLTLVGLAACGKSDSTQTKIVLTGSSTIAPVMVEIAQRYEAQNPDVRIEVQTGGSSRGIKDAITGAADIGMSSRALKEGEGEELTSVTLALDGVAFLVNAENSVSALSDEQLLDVFTGKIDNWKTIGGDDAEIIVITRADGRSEVELFDSYFDSANTEKKPDLIAGENQQALKLIHANSGAITYVSLGAAEYDSRSSGKTKLLPLRGVAATKANVQNGSYPMARPLVLLTNKNLSPAAKKFLAFSQSEQVHDIIESLNFVAAP